MAFVTTRRRGRTAWRTIALHGIVAMLAGAGVLALQLDGVAAGSHAHCDVDDDSGTRFNHGLGDGADTDRWLHPFIQEADPACPNIEPNYNPGDMRANIELRRADGRFRGGYFLVASNDCQGCDHLDLSRDTNFPECHYGWYGSASIAGNFAKEIRSHTHFHHNFCGKVHR